MSRSSNSNSNSNNPVEPAGWIQSFDALTEVVINGAGHLAPMNQPERLVTMISNFVYNNEFLIKK